MAATPATSSEPAAAEELDRGRGRNPLWARLAWFAVLWVVVFALKGVGEFFPFSHFPMYSTFSDSAYVLRVETADGTQVPLVPVFGKKENRCKKIWQRRLKELTNARGADSAEATDAELEEAGLFMLEQIVGERRYGKLEEFETDRLRLFARELKMLDDDKFVTGDRLVAELVLEPGR